MRLSYDIYNCFITIMIKIMIIVYSKHWLATHIVKKDKALLSNGVTHSF